MELKLVSTAPPYAKPRNYVPSCLPAPEIECSQTQAQRIISLSYNRFKVFRYSFFGTIPNFLNRLLDNPFLVRSKRNLQYLLVLD